MEYSVLLMLLAFTNSVIGEGCCKSKVVGGSTYTFTGEEDTSTFSCLDQCIYTKEGEENSKYCFAVGPMQVECKDTGSDEAGSTGGSGGGVAGSTAGGGEVAETTAGAVGEAVGAVDVAETTAGGGGEPETTASAVGGAESTASAGGVTETAAGAGGVTAADKPAATVAGGSGSTNGTTTNGTKVVWPLLTSPVPSQFSKYTTVFGVGVLGHSSVSDVKFRHVASVLASWLDNDQDGCVDNPLVLTKMLAASPKPIFLAAGPSEPSNSAVEAIINKGMEPAALVFNNELLPNCAGTASDNECADATLEEVLHMVTDKGYAEAWPATFSPSKTSTLTKAMDVARGGKFTTIPSPYPTSAWYTYNDQTCTYQCMATEYIYWGVSSWVGALDKRTGVTNEWKFNTKAKLVAGDALMTAIIKDTSVYKLPNISPTGIYSGASTCSSGANHS